MEAGKDKNLPMTFNLDVWQLCDEVIGTQEHVKFAGAMSGDTGRAHATVGLKDGKRQSNAQEFMQLSPDGDYDWRLPRCRAERGMDPEEIFQRRASLGERHISGVEPDEETKMKKRDEEHWKEGLSTGQQRKKVGDIGFDRLVDALHETTAQTLEHGALQLTFKKERHCDAMKLARDRLQQEARQLENQAIQQQQKQAIEEKRLPLEKEAIASSNFTMQTLSQVLAALATTARNS